MSCVIVARAGEAQRAARSASYSAIAVSWVPSVASAYLLPAPTTMSLLVWAALKIEVDREPVGTEPSAIVARRRATSRSRQDYSSLRISFCLKLVYGG